MNAPAINLAAVAMGVLGVIGCVVGGIAAPTAFFQAWLCSYLFWLGVPLAGITLVLAHDLSGGDWMETARPFVDAAIATTPLASLAGIAAFVRLDSLYPWVHPPAGLGNAFYLNPGGFFIRYGIFVVVWNMLAAFALWGPREGGRPIAPRLSWISGLGLVALALSCSFAAIDWILSLEPDFWSSIFPYAHCASWFNTGMALVLLGVAVTGRPAAERLDHMADLARIMLATTIFWAYAEFMQFLIIWEENLKSEIPWYLKRLGSAWQPAIFVSAGLGFAVPFLMLLWAPTKRSPVIVAAACASILISRLADSWLLVMPEFANAAPFWLDVAAALALGGAMLLLFIVALRHGHRVLPEPHPIWTADHG